MRFCLVTTFYPPFHPGGCGLHVYHLARLLAEAGHEVDVLCSARAHRLKIASARPGEYPDHPGVRVIRIPGGKMDVLSTYLFGRGPSSSRSLRRRLQAGYDVIHYHNVSLLGGVPSLSWGRARLRLFTQHTYWLLCPLHYLWKFNREPCRQKACFRCLGWAGKPPLIPWRAGSRFLGQLDGIDSLIMPCRDMRARHRAAGITVRMDHLPYFVAPVPPGRQQSLREFGLERPYYLLVSRLESYKGPQVALEAFLSRPGEADLIIVGTGSLEKELKRRAAGDPRVRFLDYVAPENLEGLYARARALLAPSLWPEMGNQTVLQAASCGTPALASRVGCLPELVEENAAGLMFTGPDGLIEGLERFQDERLRSELGGNAQTAYRGKYAPEVFREKYLSLVGELSARKVHM